MNRKVLIIDTSVLCCWLEVPGKETAGPAHDQWNHARIEHLLTKEKSGGSIFVLPLATLIETGNHIAQASGRRLECARSLAIHLNQAADAATPWAAFTDQSPLWEAQHLKALAESWPELANSKLSIGDATIKSVAEYYAKGGYTVEILTGDQGLKAHEPARPITIPRRRQ
jgi:hypothetical protein